MYSDLFVVTEGDPDIQTVTLISELLICASKFSKDLSTLVNIINAIADANSLKIEATNKLLTDFALGKVRKEKREKRVPVKMASYHAFRAIIKPELLRLMPNSTISNINRYTSLVWKAVDESQKAQWSNDFCELTTDMANKWNTSFCNIVKATLEEDTDSMIADEDIEDVIDESETIEHVPDTSDHVNKRPRRKNVTHSAQSMFIHLISKDIPEEVDANSIVKFSNYAWNCLSPNIKEKWNSEFSTTSNLSNWKVIFKEHLNKIVTE